MRKFLRIGKIISLHGIKGEVKIFPTTDDIKRFDVLKRIYIVDDEDFDKDELSDELLYEVESVKYFKKLVILKIKTLDSIEQSSKYIKKNIYVSREDAIKLSKNEYFVIDLIGLDTIYNGESFGKVVDIMKTKANDILVVISGGKEILIPLVDVYIDNINLDNKNITLKNLEGLI